MSRRQLQHLSIVAVAVLILGVVILPTAAAQSTDSDSLESILEQVDEQRSKGAFEEVHSRLTGLRNKHGNRVEILWRLSFVHVDIGKSTDDKELAQERYQEALRIAETALEVDSTSARAHLAMAVAEGRLALEAGTQERVQRSRAIKRHSDRAIELDSTLSGAFHVRGRWNREVSDLNFFERTVVRTVYGGLPEASFEQAVEDFKRAIELENVRFHHLELAKTYLKMDRRESAREHLRTVIELPQREAFGDEYKKEAQQLLEDMG